MSSSVTAVIPTWNRADLLRSILENLRSQTVRLDEILVVDNGSSDNSAQVAGEFGVRLIRFPENRGFAVAVNEGIRQASSDWILIVNNDVVLQPDWLQVSLRAVATSNALFAVGKLLRPLSSDPADASAHIDGSFDLISRAAYAWRSGYGKPDGPVWSTARRVHFAPMTAALFHRSVFQKVGLLPTRFESYYEDVDLGVRCALAGIEGIYEPAAVATHMSKTTLGKSSARVYFLTARNQVFLLAKYFSRPTLRRFLWPILWGQLLSLGAAARQRNLWSALRGKYAGLQGWKSFRNELPSNTAAVERTFLDSEREILRLQQQTGFDIYWKLYFRLVRPR